MTVTGCCGGSDLQVNVDCCGQIDEQLEAFLLVGGEAIRCYVESVVAGHDFGKDVAALLVGGGGALGIRVRIRQTHGGVGDRGVAGVGDDAAKRRGRLRP